MNRKTKKRFSWDVLAVNGSSATDTAAPSGAVRFQSLQTEAALRRIHGHPKMENGWTCSDVVGTASWKRISINSKRRIYANEYGWLIEHICNYAKIYMKISHRIMVCKTPWTVCWLPSTPTVCSCIGSTWICPHISWSTASLPWSLMLCIDPRRPALIHVALLSRSTIRKLLKKIVKC